MNNRRRLQTTTRWLFAKASPAGAKAPGASEAGVELVVQDAAAQFDCDVPEEYEVLDSISSGSVCDVYRAYSKTLGQEIALKVLSADHQNNQAALRQFKKEVDAACTLSHPSIAAVFGYGTTTSGAPFLVQELCRGKNLGDVIKECAQLIDRKRALSIFLQISDAMAHAHLNAVLHRDLKPANVMICSNGNDESVKLIDFGLSTVLQSAGTAITDVTRTGEIFGTPHYMSPEQCLGDKIDYRSDIYSFGCLMYEVMKGRPPFPGFNPVQIIMSQLKNEPAPLVEDERADAELTALQDIIFRCLRKNPEERFQSFDEIAIALQGIQSGKFSRIEPAKIPTFPSLAIRLLSAVLDGLVISALLGLVLRLCVGAWPYLMVEGMQPLVSLAAQMKPLWDIVFFFNPEYFIVNALADTAPLITYQTYSKTAVTLLVALYPLIACCYHAAFISSRLRATPGQFLLGLSVCRLNGAKLSYKQAELRFAVRIFAAQEAVLRTWLGDRAPIDYVSKSCLIRGKGSSKLQLLPPVELAAKLSLEKIHGQQRKLQVLLVIMGYPCFCLINLIPCFFIVFREFAYVLYYLLSAVALICFKLAMLEDKKKKLLLQRNVKQDHRLAVWTTNLMRRFSNAEGKP